MRAGVFFMTGTNVTPKTVCCLAGLLTAGLLAVSWPAAAQAAGAGGIVVKQNIIDLFQGPGTGYAITGTAGRGETVDVIGRKGSWDEVRASAGATGWIPGILVTLDEGRQLPATTALPAAVTPVAACVNIRSGPGTGFPVLTTVKQGDYLVVQERSGRWYEVLTPDGILGWIAGWLTRPASASARPSTPVSGAGRAAAGPGTVTVSQPQITLFAGPGTGYPVVGQVSGGTVLTVLATLGGWTRVRMPGQTEGWIPSVIASLDRTGGSPSSRGLPGRSPAGIPFAGKGEWFDIYDPLPRPGDLRAMAAAGVTHVYLEVATSRSGFPARWRNWLNILLPEAHRVGLKVIAWLYVSLKNPCRDAQLTSQVANYVTPQGYRPDGVAADIETLPRNNPVAASQLVTSYAVLTRSKLPSGMPFIAITFPPQYRPSYPYAAMAAEFNGIALMDYWHITPNDYNYDDARSFVADSLALTTKLAGTRVPLEAILQGYSNGTGLPSAREMEGALAGAARAQGYSLFTWDSALGTPAGNIFNAYR